MGKGVSLNQGRMIDDNGTPELQVDLHFTGGNDIYMPIAVPLRSGAMSRTRSTASACARTKTARRSTCRT